MQKDADFGLRIAWDRILFALRIVENRIARIVSKKVPRIASNVAHGEKFQAGVPLGWDPALFAYRQNLPT